MKKIEINAPKIGVVELDVTLKEVRSDTSDIDLTVHRLHPMMMQMLRAMGGIEKGETTTVTLPRDFIKGVYEFAGEALGYSE